MATTTELDDVKQEDFEPESTTLANQSAAQITASNEDAAAATAAHAEVPNADDEEEEKAEVEPAADQTGGDAAAVAPPEAEEDPAASAEPAAAEQQQQDESMNGGGDTDDGGSGDVDGDVDFVDIGGGGALQEEDFSSIGIEIPPKPDIINHLQATFQTERLIIDRMRVVNFKSFGGEHWIGHFHPRFVIVNGPNGCGKSNVVDGLLFVFGERSKRLRVERISELIYNPPDSASPWGAAAAETTSTTVAVTNGHKKRRRRNNKNRTIDDDTADSHLPTECRVDVFMKLIRQTGENEFEDVPGSKSSICVGRVGRKNGTSTYYLNDKVSNRTEIVQELKERGIDMDHHRFLILQGEVEQIALMPPKAKNEHEEGLLEYLEDIIGTKRLQEPMEKLQNLIDKVKEDYAVKAKHQFFKRNEVTKLMPERQRAEIILLENNAIHFKKYQLKLIEKLHASDARSAHVESYDAKSAEFAALDTQLKQLEKRKKQLETECTQTDHQVEQNSQAQQDAEQERSELVEKISKYAVDIEHAETAKTKLSKEITALEKEINEIDTLPARLQAEISDLKEKSAEMQQNVDSSKTHYDSVVANASSAVDELRKEKQKVEQRQKPLKKQLQGKKQEHDKFKQEHDLTHRKFKSAEVEFEKVTNEKPAKEQELEKLRNELDNIEGRVSTKTDLLDDREQARASAREEHDKLTETLNTKRVELDAAQAKLHAQATASNAGGAGGKQSPELRALMQAMPSGIIGRLGDLAGIDERYDVAICSLMQNTLNAILVENSTVARGCINYLRENRISDRPIKFLDQERKWQQNERDMQRTFSNPHAGADAAPRLFDLLQCADEKISAVYYSFLRDTLVTETTEQAQRIVFGSNNNRRGSVSTNQGHSRAVTLQGNVIESSGSMTGGGQPVRGLIGREARVVVRRDPRSGSGRVVVEPPVNIDALQRELAELQRELHAKVEELQNIEAQVVTYRKERDELQKKQRDLPSKIAALEKRLRDEIPLVEASARELCDKHRPSEDVENAYETELEEFKQAIIVIESDLLVCTNEIENIERQMGDMSTGVAQEAKAQLEEAKQLLADHVKLLEKKESELANSDKQLGKYKKQLEHKRKSVEEKEKAVAEIMQNKTESQQNLEKVDTETITQLKQQAEQLLAAHSSALELLQQCTQEHTHGIKSCGQLQNDLDNLRVRLAEEKKKEQTIDRDIAKILTNIQELSAGMREQNAKYLRRDLTDDELRALVADVLERQIKKRESLMQERKANPIDAQRVLNEFRARHDAWTAAAAEAKKVEMQRKKCEAFYRKIQNMRFEEFFEAYRTINNELKWIFRKLTLGGNAALSVADDLVFYENGIDFKVQPLMKPWREISHLSGGEKTLSSLSLIFALHKFRPTPFYIMDEIDAALDYRNVTLVGLFVKLQAAAGQFIVVSHRPEMIVKADRIIGITKPGGQTCSIAVACDLDQRNTIEQLVLMEEEKLSKAEQKQLQQLELMR